MALCKRIVERSLGLVQYNISKASTPQTRSLTSLATCSSRFLQYPAPSRFQQRRHLNASTERSITGQEAPSAQAYIKSGVLSGKKDLVDVKKVLVIGSGGLSIGQAGEFDYSGR